MASATTGSMFEIMYTCRSMRRFTSQDVPEATVRELVDAAIRAPSGGNAQGLRFIVVRDPDVKRRLAEEVRKGTGWKITVDEGASRRHVAPVPSPGRMRRERDAGSPSSRR